MTAPARRRPSSFNAGSWRPGGTIDGLSCLSLRCLWARAVPTYDQNSNTVARRILECHRVMTAENNDIERTPKHTKQHVRRRGMPDSIRPETAAIRQSSKLHEINPDHALGPSGQANAVTSDHRRNDASDGRIPVGQHQGRVALKESAANTKNRRTASGLKASLPMGAHCMSHFIPRRSSFRFYLFAFSQNLYFRVIKPP